MHVAIINFNHQFVGNLTRWRDIRASNWKPNYGDMLVCAAILRQLNPQQTVRVPFGKEISSPVDRAIIRGSTYMHPRFDFEAANRTIDSIDSQVAVVGLGAQNATQDVTILDGSTAARDFIARLNEKSRSISVRGAYSAAVVERLGGRNIRITGCPSLFYELSRTELRLPEMLRRPQRSLGISVHTGLRKTIYCHDPRATRALHGRLLRWAIDNSAQVSVFEQGVLLEYSVADQSLPFEERRAAAAEILANIEADQLMEPEDLMARMVSVQSIEEWLAKARDLDAIIGFRFHGNMVALLQGKPCYYFTYDSRLKEFAEVYGLPHRDVTEDWKDPIAAMLDHDWDDSNRRIAGRYDELKVFYEENGFEHSLV